MKILLGLCLAFALASATGDDSSSNHQYVFVTKQEPLDLLNFDPRHISSGSSGQKFQGGYYGGNRRRYGTFNTQGFHQHGHSNAFQPVTHQNFIPGFSHQSRPNALVFPASHGHHQNHIQTGGGYFPYPHNSYGRFPIVSYGPQSLIPNAGVFVGTPIGSLGASIGRPHSHHHHQNFGNYPRYPQRNFFPI